MRAGPDGKNPGVIAQDDFEPESEILAQLARLVDLERQCCEFLTFRIVVGAAREPFSLEITGPAEAKPMIADFFGS